MHHKRMLIDTLSLDASMFNTYDTYSWFVNPNQEIFNQNSSASLLSNHQQFQ